MLVKKNIVLDNLIFYLQNTGGVSVYWKELLVRHLNSNKAITLVEPKSKKQNNIFFEDFKNRLPIVKEFLNPSVLRFLPITIKLKKKSIFHSSYLRFSIQSSVKNILTIHDMSYERKVIKSRGLKRLIHIMYKSISLKIADGIICVSEATKKDLLYFYPYLEKKKIRVIYNGVSEDYAQNKMVKRNLSNILYVGGRGPYKNFNLLVEAISILKSYRLIIAGGGDLTFKEKKYLEEKIAGKYELHTSLSNAQLNNLYNSSFCLIYPSQYEGFGIPVVEAMRAGCPVICSNLSSLPEIANNAAILITPSLEEILGAIKLFEDEKIRRDYISKGLLRGNYFSWDKCYLETIEFFYTV